MEANSWVATLRGYAVDLAEVLTITKYVIVEVFAFATFLYGLYRIGRKIIDGL